MGDIILRRAEDGGDVLAVQQLWREYWASINLPLDFQGFREELARLPGAYGSEGGALLLALADDEPAGTVALRRLNSTSGEVKRLYLRPQYRGRGVGRRLLSAVIERANAIGYDTLYADTLPSMLEALSLYQRAGFVPVEPYSSTPTPGAIYLERKLLSSGGTEPDARL